MNPYEILGRILDVPPDDLAELDRVMVERTGREGIIAKIVAENEAGIGRTLDILGVSRAARSEEVRRALEDAIVRHEVELVHHLETIPGTDQFEKSANLARSIARVEKGWFLKKSLGADILRAHRPEQLLEFLGYRDVTELLARHDVPEIFSALRFIETDAWMHETFASAYGKFTPDDFEERPIEVRVLGSEWREVAARFVAKKHHNVSHLKEFGVIFLNPIAEDRPAKFIRDFALLFHYFHEIEFYSRLFRYYARQDDFSSHLQSLLRGDVPEKKEVAPGEWLIVQRYLFKDNPRDPRLFLPRVNPESIHWLRGERDLVRLGEERDDIGLELWRELDWVGSRFYENDGPIVSFDLEDNAMSAVAAREGRNEYLNYHQREALWSRLFIEYAGSEQAMDDMLMANFMKGSIVFPSRS